jgi:HPt (histidine-containing phosphotransfer) domain-containing protein
MIKFFKNRIKIEMKKLDINYSDINYEERAAKIGVKPNLIHLIFKSFVDECGSLLQNLQNSLELGEYEKIKSYAHAIKGSAGNLQLYEIYEMAKEIEFMAKEKNSDFAYKEYLDAIKNAIATISL